MREQFKRDWNVICLCPLTTVQISSEIRSHGVRWKRRDLATLFWSNVAVKGTWDRHSQSHESGSKSCGAAAAGDLSVTFGYCFQEVYVCVYT